MAKVLLFGPVSDRLETEVLTILNCRITSRLSPTYLWNWLKKVPTGKKCLLAENLQNTVNRQFADANSAITNNDEIALISLPGKI